MPVALRHRLPFALLLAGLLASFAAQLPAQADSIEVDAYCSLSDAIRAANSDAARGGCPAGDGADTISLSADIRLTGPLPAINSEITINGRNHTIDGGTNYRIFDMNSGSATINNLSMTRGNAGVGNGGAVRARNSDLILNRVSISDSKSGGGGGGLHFSGPTKSLAITNSSFSRNQTSGSKAGQGGGLYVLASSATISSSGFASNIASTTGGAIHNGGVLAIDNSSIGDNSAADHGGGIYTSSEATTAITHVTLADNRVLGEGKTGAGIYNSGELALYNSVIAGSPGDSASLCAGESPLRQAANLIQDASCSAELRGDPGIGAPTGSPVHYPLREGSPAVDAASAAHCTTRDQLGSRRPAQTCDIGAIESNGPGLIRLGELCSLPDAIKTAAQTSPAGGCIVDSSADVDIDTIVFRADIQHSGAPLTIRLPMIIDGQGLTLAGDGTQRLLDIVDASVIIKNLAIINGDAGDAHGGAVRARNADLTLDNVRISDSGSGNNGGGLYFDGGAKRLAIVNSSFANNATNNNDKGGKGGALFVHARQAIIQNSSFTDNRAVTRGGAIHNDGELTIENSTISGNSAASQGGGVFTNSGATTTMRHVTIAHDDESDSGSDGLGLYRGGATYLYNSIVAGGAGSEQSLCAGAGSLTQAGSLIQDNSCSPALSGFVGLGGLTGSPAVQTLRGDSPAIDAASSAHCLDSDQLGAPRPQHLACDMGAFEVPADDIAPTPTLAPTPTPTATPSAPPTRFFIDASCALQDAIQSANSNTAHGGCPAGGGGYDSITLTESVSLQGDLDAIVSAIRIDGAGFSISGNGERQIFSVSSEGDLSLNNISLINGSAGAGGAVNNAGALAINRVYLADNSSSGAGGAIHSTGRLIISNSTFADNNSAEAGGAVYIAGGTAWLTHVTLNNNRSETSADLHIAAGTVNMRNSLIAGATDSSRCVGALSENLGNFIQDASCSPARSGDPRLGELTIYPIGGAYFPLLDGSPALGNGDDYFCSQYPRDQLNAPRRAGDCHIGAVDR
ncbi:MAG: hypothetical protein OXE95_04870 [Chloroflexi bacterium]|nr:hypothetical protein [Chloroflexota bacterium]